jgi:5-methylcytosine-specific restriction endonuclease McrA
MGKLIDLTGQRFGKLLVIERELSEKYKKPKWICQCDCGKLSSVTGDSLKRDNTKSCGCLIFFPENTKNKGRKVKDLVGQRFGKLVVIKFSHIIKSDGAQWLCKCDCGNEKIISGRNLRKSNSTSCGCKRSEHLVVFGLKKRKNIIGNKYGRLFVIEFSHINKSNSAFWICECNCGNIVIVQGTKLRSGHTKSCGCLLKDFAKENFFIDITGETFGYFFVEKFVSIGERGSQWECLCKCGNRKIVYATDLKAGHVTSCGCKRRTILKKYEDSDKSFTERELVRQSVEYSEWRTSVFKTGNYICEKCGQRGGYIEAHHVLSFDKNLEERFDVKNGIVFCKHCHVDFHKNYGFGDNTREQLKEFL